MSKVKKNKQVVKEKLGKPILYLGLGNTFQNCVFCNRKFTKQIVLEFKGKLFCNDDCIRMYLLDNEK